MAEWIDVRPEELDEYISMLKLLHDDWLNSEQMRRAAKPNASGSGQVNAALEIVMTELESVNDAVLLLLSNSIQFFTNVKNSVVSADQTGADAISK